MFGSPISECTLLMADQLIKDITCSSMTHSVNNLKIDSLTEKKRGHYRIQNGLHYLKKKHFNSIFQKSNSFFFLDFISFSKFYFKKDEKPPVCRIHIYFNAHR